MKRDLTEKIDKTIEAVCDRVERETKDAITTKDTADLLKSLADVIIARASLRE